MEISHFFLNKYNNNNNLNLIDTFMKFDPPSLCFLFRVFLAVATGQLFSTLNWANFNRVFGSALVSEIFFEITMYVSFMSP